MGISTILRKANASGIAAGTAFDALPDSWVCPVCGAPKTEFERKARHDRACCAGRGKKQGGVKGRCCWRRGFQTLAPPERARCGTFTIWAIRFSSSSPHPGVSAFEWYCRRVYPTRGRSSISSPSLGFAGWRTSSGITCWNRMSSATPRNPGEVCRRACGEKHDSEEGEAHPRRVCCPGLPRGIGVDRIQEKGTVCGIKLPGGLQESQKLEEPIFTPTTKATRDTTSPSHRRACVT